MIQEAAAASAYDAGEGVKSYTIGDLAREFGVTLRALRSYEDRGLLSPAATERLASTTPGTAAACP